jgi:hypothetical protein
LTITRWRDIDGDPAGLILGQHLGLDRFGLAVSRVNPSERLTVGVADDIAARYLVGAPGRREAA